MKKLVLLLAMLLAVSSFANTYPNSVAWSGTGNWMQSQYWTDDPAAPDWGIPGWVNGNDLNIDGSTDPDWNGGWAMINSGTLNLTPTSRPDGHVAKIYMGSEATNVTLNISGDLAVRQTSYFGYNTLQTPVVTVNQTAGNVVFGTDVSISARRTYFGCGGSNVTYNLSGGTMTSNDDYTNFGYNGTSTFTFNQTGGTFTDTTGGAAAGASGLQIGYDKTATGIVNLSGGTFNADADYIWIGKGVVSGTNHATGIFNQTGGIFNAHRIVVSDKAASTGLLKISGGELHCDMYWTNRNDGKSVISGSGATKIDTKQFSLAGSETVAGRILGIELDGNGSTLIEVTGLAEEAYHGAFLAYGILEVSALAGFDADSLYDILWSAAELTTDGLTFNNLTGVNMDWRVVNYTLGGVDGQMLQLVVPEPATICVLTLGSLMMVRRKRA